jgi:hypothetical protein
MVYTEKMAKSSSSSRASSSPYAKSRSSKGSKDVYESYDSDGNKAPFLPPITSPAIVALVGYAILVFIVLLPVDMYVYDDKTNQYSKQQYSFWFRLILAVLLLFPFLLSVYSINCMMVGDCRLWSWVVALLTLLWAIVIVITTLSSGSFSLDQIS